MASLEGFLAKRLRLKVNREKSAVARPWRRKFLGYSTTVQRETKLRVAPESVKRLKVKLRPLLRRGRGRNLKAVIADLNRRTRGWVAYYRLAQARTSFEELDKWLRRKLRLIQWRQWKRPRARFKKLIKLGLTRQEAAMAAYNRRGPWWNAEHSMNRAMPNAVLRELGLMSLLEEHRRLECPT